MSAAGPEAGYLAALAGFDAMTPARLRHLITGRTGADAFAIAAGELPPSPAIASVFAKDASLADRWRRSATTRDPVACGEASVAAGVDVFRADDPAVPPQLASDPACPAVLFVRGDLAVLDARRVGIIGTRNATQAGRSTAARFGAELADVGVTVLSGLARGIDAAAHRGALSAPSATPVAVVGNGLDCPYPRQNAELWEAIAARGALISEWPVGTAPDAFRFPLRNRVLAALVEVLVVVESRARGGSLITVREALHRSVEVMVVPGSVHSRASEGTNHLLSEGAAPANEPADVLVALGLDHRRAGRARFDSRPRLDGVDAEVYAACRDTPRTIEAVMVLTGASLGDAAMLLARLERSGWLIETGGWFEAVDEWAELA